MIPHVCPCHVCHMTCVKCVTFSNYGVIPVILINLKLYRIRHFFGLHSKPKPTVYIQLIPLCNCTTGTCIHFAKYRKNSYPKCALILNLNPPWSWLYRDSNKASGNISVQNDKASILVLFFSFDLLNLYDITHSRVMIDLQKINTTL